MPKVKYQPGTGKHVIVDDNIPKHCGSILGEAVKTFGGGYETPIGEAREEFNPSNGRYELLDEENKVVGIAKKRGF